MNKLRLLIVLLVCIACKSQTTSKINGISFVASANKLVKEDIYPIKEVSANYVTLMPFAFMKSLSSPTVIYNSERQWFGETEAGIKQYGKEFQKQDIKVMIKPQIWVWNGAYTGKITMENDKNWKLLEDSYETYLITFAKVAEEINAEIFCIGTELEQFVKNRPEYWLKLIKKIKKVYSGKLTYAANWDAFTRVPFWDALDFIGIDAYFPLSNKKTPTVNDFEKSWLPHKKQIQQHQKKYGKPILFTEYGYRSIDFTGKEPWSSHRVDGAVNLQNQENALKALYHQFWKEDWFAGGFLWKWFHNHTEVGGKNDNRFTPQNKPAQKTIKQYYK